MDKRGEEILKMLKEPGVLTDELKREILELLVFHYGPAPASHQKLRDFLLALMRVFVETRGLGIVLGSPFQMKLARSGREPDLLFVAKENLERLRSPYLERPANLVVEIVSPESERRDRGEKFWELSPSGKFQLLMEGSKGVYQSKAVEGFWLRIEWLWDLPPILEALRELRRDKGEQRKLALFFTGGMR